MSNLDGKRDEYLKTEALATLTSLRIGCLVEVGHDASSLHLCEGV